MRRSLILLALGTAITACVPGSPVYFGPPIVILVGEVQLFEERQPIPNAEVCVFGTDTLCVASDQNGSYRAEMREAFLLEGKSLTVRFRAPGLPSALAELHDVETGDPTRLDCAISSRFTLSNRPVACLPIQR